MPLVAQNPVPRVILGLMTFGPEGSESKGARLSSLDKCLDYFQQQGFNEVDTARIYVGGEQEAFTAQAKWRERGLTLATKWYPKTPGDHKAKVLRQNVELSLKELQTNQVDIFYLHAPDRSVPFTETLEEVNKLHKEGKFVELGLSNFTAFEVAEVVTICNERGWVRPTIYQGMYNAISEFILLVSELGTHGLTWNNRHIARSIETELVHACRRYHMDIVIYNPLAGGILSGQLYRSRYFKDATFDALRIIEPVVEKHGLTMAETALRWVHHHSALKMDNHGRDGVLIGVSNFEQLEHNLRDMQKGPLPAEVVEALDQAWLVTKPTTPNYWHLDLKYTYNTFGSRN